MKRIILSNERVRAEILPEFGAAVAHLSIAGTEVLRMDEGLLGVSNTLAGGIPVLFPFVSANPDSRVTFGGMDYTMPTHGFAKDLPFSVLREEARECELCLKSSEVTKVFYPFDFEFRLVYALEGDALKTTMIVKNTGEGELPFAAGFHPYFLTPDRSRTRFSFGLKEYWNYLSCDEAGKPLHGMLKGELKLSDEHDTVFFNGDADCEIICEEPAYRVKMECGETFDVITVCTNLENASCVEPWQGRPGAAQRPEECQRLAAGEEGSYSYVLRLG